MNRIHLVAAVLCFWCAPASMADCPGDVNDDGVVDVSDLLQVLGEWGPCPPQGACPSDIDGNGAVDVGDLLVVLGGYGPCPPPFAPPPTIVVYNLNHPDVDGNGTNDALEIAQHYVTARGLDDSALCGVRLPTGEHGTPAELLGARKTIVEQCICGALPQEVQDATGCSIDSPGALEAIRDASPISHMVLIKGLPAKLFDVDWPDQDQGDRRGPSFGFYLSYLIYRDADIFEDIGLLEPLLYPTAADSEWGYLPPLDPGAHEFITHGRVEALTKQRTIDLIDRTLAAEGAGFRGNLLLESTDPFFFDLTSTHDSACLDYLQDPMGTWPYESCRVGTTDDDVVPGTDGSHVPFAIDAGLLHGTTVLNGSGIHAAFSSFETMLNWHKSQEGCVELCEDLPTQQERDDCAASSTDYFKQLNTDCVGAAPGFMAHQVRSFVVQYYGFNPPGWRFAWYSTHLKSMPLILEGDAYNGGQFSDDRYAHYGVYDHLNPDTSTCTMADGTTVPCPAHLAVNLSTAFNVADVPLDEARQFTLTFRYRYAGPSANLKVRLQYTVTDLTAFNTSIVNVPVTDSAGGWNTATRVFTIGPVEGESVILMGVALWSRDQGDLPAAWTEPTVSGFLDLDGFELVDAVTLQDVFPLDVGSFTRETVNTTIQGDWPANTIDRLGGIANWGEGTHHAPQPLKMGGGSLPAAFFSGRTLGEAWAHEGGKATGHAGLTFGDPLYRPVAVKISAFDFVDVYQGDRIGDPDGYDVWLDTYEDLDLRVHALHGTDNLQTTRWEISTCPDLGIEACQGNWTSYAQGTGAVDGHALGGFENLVDVGQDQTLTLKLRVWNDGDEGNDLANYAYFRYWAHPLPHCAGDGNGDGVVSLGDEGELLHYWCPRSLCAQICPIVDGFCIADVDQDGVVGVLDNSFVLGNFGDCQDPLNCPADINGDGTVDGLDIDLVQLYWDSCPIVDGSCTADANGDGVVDTLDYLFVLGWFGSCQDPMNCPADVNGDGTVDQLDLEFVTHYLSCTDPCPIPYEDCPIDPDTGFCVYDLDLDGDVDGIDDLILQNNLGPCQP